MKLTEEAKELNLFEVGMRIQQARLEKGIKSIDMALALDLSKNAYSRIENGKAMINADKLFKLSQYLDTPVDFFISGKKPDIVIYNITKLLTGKNRKDLEKLLKVLEIIFG